MRRPNGSIAVAYVKGVPIYLHWSFPVGAFIPISFAQFEPIPSLLLCAGSILLVAIHEMGHLAAARVSDHHVFSLEISGAGGKCWTEAPRNATAEMLIYSGGLLAQLALFVVGLFAFPFVDDVRSDLFSYFVITATVMNAAMFIMNLVPRQPRNGGLPSDGYVLWQILRRPLGKHA
jgi:hypothetical protein